MAAVEQILNEEDNYSELSIDASFTLEDILQEPADEDTQVFDNLNDIDDLDAYFDNDDVDINDMFEDDKGEDNTPKNAFQSEKINDDEIEKIKMKSESSVNESKIRAEVRRWARLEDLPSPSISEIKNMIYIPLKNVSELFDISTSQTKGVGVPTCISTSDRFLAIGTSIGNIVIFEIGLTYKILNSPDQFKYKQVTSVSVSRDNRYLVSGYESGLVILWDLYEMKQVKTVLLQKNRILKVLFTGDGYENFISNDSEGYIYMFTVEKHLWTGVRSQLLIDKTDKVYYDVKYSKINNGKQILALSTLNSVILISLKPTPAIIVEIERPKGITNTKIPNCEIGQNPSSTEPKIKNNILCVSWGRFVHLYKIIGETATTERIVLDFVFEQVSGVHHMEFIANGILVTVDNRQVFRIVNVNDLKKKVKEGEKYVKSESISENQLESETIYQRFLKDKEGRFIKSYSNTIINCVHNPRYKEIFMICKNSVYRGRLSKWNEYMSLLLDEQKNWENALKLCLELYKGRYNIFVEPFVNNEATLKLMREVGLIFYRERMKEINGRRTEGNSIKEVLKEVKEMFEVTIEYFCAISCEDFLFTHILKDISEKYFYEYEEEFLDCLEPFIENGLIRKIPTRELFVKIIEFFSEKPAVINKLIISLQEDSLYFEDAVEICSREKLYESLCYICSFSGDFISPANKIMIHLQQNPNDTENYNNLKNYLQNLINLKYPNGKPITNNATNMLNDISIWLFCDECLQYMCKNYSEDYFKMLSVLIQRMLEFDLVNQIPLLAEQVIEKLKVIKEERLLPELVEFLIDIGLSEKIHFSQELLIKTLNICEEIYTTLDTSTFPKALKYLKILKFLEKYFLMDKSPQTEEIRSKYEESLIAKLNIWVKLSYYMLSNKEREKLLEESPKVLRNEDIGRDFSFGYIFENSQRYKETIDKYEDLLIQWSPDQSLICIIRMKGYNGMKDINRHIMNIEDEKLRYAVIRKILRLLRKNKNLSIVAPNNEIISILRAAVRNSSTSNSAIANQLETSLSDTVLLFYIESICKYKNEKRIFEELHQNKEQYRSILTQLLPAFQKYAYHSCIGLIFEEQLKYKDAFNEYSIVYREYFKINFSKLVKYEYCHGRFMGKMFHLMMGLCLKIRQEEQWGILISVVLGPLQMKDYTSGESGKIVDTIQKIYEIKTSKRYPFMQELFEVIEVTLVSMSREVSISLMGIELNKYTDLLTKSFVVSCLMSTLKSCRKRVETFEISTKLMVTEFVNQFEEFFKVNKLQGCSTSNECEECGESSNSRNYSPNLNGIKFEILKCGHSYHEECFKKNDCKCKICTKQEYGDYDDNELKDKENEGKDDKNGGIGERVGTFPLAVQELENEYDMREEILKHMAFEDYLNSEEENFENFRQQYEGYITAYKNH